MSQDGSMATFSPEGALVLGTIKENASTAIWELQASEGLSVDLSKIDRIDSTGLQLLAALSLHCKKHGKTFTLEKTSAGVERFFVFFGLAQDHFDCSKSKQ